MNARLLMSAAFGAVVWFACQSLGRSRADRVRSRAQPKPPAVERWEGEGGALPTGANVPAGGTTQGALP